ncbi:hypothetical protein HKW97_24345 (plasmid) [Pseudomonas luteola]|uniref:hypothetical protein n=1 Tax=Pseudomonas luteola TaxID=47886 RepID=UPI00388CF6EB
MKVLVDAIEAGKQRGASRQLIINGVAYWVDGAVQKHRDLYYAHVSEIREDQMAAEKYSKYLTCSFKTLDAALRFIEAESHFRHDELVAAFSCSCLER